MYKATAITILLATIAALSIAGTPATKPSDKARQDRRTLSHMHDAHVRDFIGRPGNGVYRMGPPGSYIGATVPIDGATYRLDSMELVGLMKHEQPTIYMQERKSEPKIESSAEELRIRVVDVNRKKLAPDKKKLKGFRTRTLNGVESGALEQLLTGENIVVRGSGKKLMATGSLRAAQSCMECHKVKEGDLLGAFSYTFSYVQD